MVRHGGANSAGVGGGRQPRPNRPAGTVKRASLTKTLLPSALLLIASLVAGVLLIEGMLRIVIPYDPMHAARELGWIRKSSFDWARFYTVDPGFGFRPILGTALYDRFGTRVNSYGLAKRPGVARLLFIGDSVTQRGRIIEALERVYGDEHFEYWNAGVESFNTVQEVAYYRRFNAAIRPDHVILTFHPNDFETTPVAFLNSAGRLVVYAPKRPLREINPWWFEQSRVYRILIALTLREERDHRAIVAEVRASLRDLRDILSRDGIRLTVLVFPTLAPLSEWKPEEARAREEVLTMLHEFGIRHFDLLSPALEAIERGVQVEEVRGDSYHPSDEVAKRFANYLEAHDLLVPAGPADAAARGSASGSSR